MEAKIKTPQELNEEAEKTFKEFSHLKISASNHIVSPTPIITINGCNISTEGNLTVLSGDSKSGKSALCSVVMAGAITPDGNDYDGFEGLEIAPNIHSKAVLHFDTEQAKHQHYKSLKYGILKRANLEKEPDYFQSYNLRELDIKNYHVVFSKLLSACSQKFGGIHCVIVDGGADFIKSVNDEHESNAIVHFFEQAAVKYKTPIIIIIHLNPNSEKQRGHLGSQLQRKAESVLAIKKNGSVSYIEPQYLRGAGINDIPQIQFEFNKEKGYHTSCGVFEKVDKAALSIKQLSELASKIFNDSPIIHSDAVNKIMTETDLSERTVKTRIKQMLDLAMVSKNSDGKYFIKSPELNFPDLENEK